MPSPFRPAVALCALALAAPTAAVAAPYEQVSRATGAAGASIMRSTGSPVALGDIGKYAGYQAGSRSFLRDIRTNVTTDLGWSTEVSVIGFDRSETFALLLRQDSEGARLTALPLPAGSSAERTVYSAPPRALDATNTRLSSDGSTVVFNDAAAKELRSMDVASGAVTTLSTDYPQYGWSVREFSVSANGRRVLGYDDATASTTIFTRTASGVTAEPTPIGGMLSPDGSAVVRIDSLNNAFWVVRDPVGPAPWTTTPFTPPAPSPGAAGLTPRWLSPTGSVLVIARSAPDAYNAYPPFALNTTTGTTGPFGGRFRESIAGTPGTSTHGYGEGTLISPSGRMALLPVSGQIVLADLTGTHIIGANEPLSADVYFNFWFTQRCTTSWLTGTKFFGTQTLKVRRPASWAPMPTRYDAQMLVDTTLLKSGSPANGDTWTVDWAGRPRYHRAKVAVTLPDGQVVQTEWNVPGGYYGACYQ